MKHLYFLICILAAISACTAPKQIEVIDLTEAKHTLRHLKEVQWPTAYREQDTILLNAILGEDFQMVDASGTWSDKTGEMAWIKRHAMEHDSFFYEIKRLDIWENGTAIVAGTGHILNDGEKTLYESTNVLIKRGKLWKAVSSHVSGIRKAGE